MMTTMKRFRIWIFLATLGSHVTGFSQNTGAQSLNLKQCIDLAIKNNLQVRQSEIQMQTNGVQFKQAKDNLLPAISGSLSEGLNYGRSINSSNNGYVDEKNGSGNYGLSSNLLLFNGLSLQQAIKENALSFDATKMDLQQQKDNITLSVILGYLMVLSNKDLLDIARQQAAVDSQQVARLDIQNRAGAIAPYTLTDLQGQYANDLVNIINALNALETSKVNLFNLLNIPYQRDATYEMVAMDANTLQYGGSSDSIFQAALHIIPNIKAADLRVRSFEKGVAVARGKLYPSLYFYGNVNSNYSSIATTTIPGSAFPVQTSDYVSFGGTNYFVNTQGALSQKISFGDQFKNNRYESIGLQLNIPILNYLTTRNNIKQAKINLVNARIVANASRNQLQQMVEQAWQNMNAAYGQYKGYMDQVNAYGESFKAAEVRFNNGVITSADYVIAKNNVDRADINLSAARYNYIFRTKILDYYQGRLTW
jgi:outer membrane protein